MKNYYQKEIETASREEILRIQNEKIVKQVKYVYDNVPYYRDLMDKKGVKPEDIQSVDDIHKLPFLSKDDLREAYPYGLLGTDLKKCVRIQSTSGTTGKRVVAFYTQKDVDQEMRPHPVHFRHDRKARSRFLHTEGCRYVGRVLRKGDRSCRRH